MGTLGAIVLAVIAGVIGYRLRRPSGPTTTQTAGADWIVEFLRLVNRDRPLEAASIRGLVWETYPHELVQYMQAQLREQPLPPVE